MIGLGYNGAAFFDNTEIVVIEDILYRFEQKTGISLKVEAATFKCGGLYDPVYEGRQTGYIINGKEFRKEPCVETWEGYLNRIKSYLFDIMMA